MDPAELAHRFQFHPADAQNTKDAHQRVRAVLLGAATELDRLVPDGREKSTAISRLEESMMWANAGIARADGPRT